MLEEDFLTESEEDFFDFLFDDIIEVLLVWFCFVYLI
jgi:hypothetical protein